MKYITLFLFLAFSSSILPGQSFAVKMDSMAKTNISKLPKDKQSQFDSILAQRLFIDLRTRIDTLNYDFVFIQENYCYSDSIGEVTERYFVHTDSIPRYVCSNGLFYNPKEDYNDFFIWYSKYFASHYTLKPLFKKYSRLKPRQILPYDKPQIWEHGCVIFEDSEAEFKQTRKKQLKTTFQIQTMIDKRNQRIIVSVQIPPNKPKFKIHSYNFVWDW